MENNKEGNLKRKCKWKKMVYVCKNMHKEVDSEFMYIETRTDTPLGTHTPLEIIILLIS